MILNLIRGFFQFILEILRTPVLEVEVLHLIIVGGLVFLVYKGLVRLFGVAKKGAAITLSASKKLLKVFSVKERASKTVCIHCGRTMVNCVCSSNKSVSLGKRLKRQKLEIKLRKQLGK